MSLLTEFLGQVQSLPGESLITRGAVRTASGVARVIGVSASTVGWVILGLEVLYSAIRSWHDAVVAERKFTDWIGRSCWGTGQSSDGEPLSGIFGQDDVEELRQFYRLFQAPRLEVNVNSPTYDPMGMTVIEAASSEVAIVFPGWQPQVSQFAVNHVYVGGNNVSAKRLSDTAQVEVEEGYGILRYRTDAIGVDSNVNIRYWPDRFADPTCVLHDEATEKRMAQDRIERLEQFQNRQQGSAS